MERTQIGWYNLKEDTVFHNNGYECAAWYENIKVPKGRYPAVVYDFRLGKDGKVEGHVSSVYALMEGIIESDYFGSMFCGVPVGGYDEKQNTGRKSRYSLSSYGFSVAQNILEDPESPWELFPEYEAREFQFQWKDETITHWNIFKK